MKKIKYLFSVILFLVLLITTAVSAQAESPVDITLSKTKILSNSELSESDNTTYLGNNGTISGNIDEFTGTIGKTRKNIIRLNDASSFEAGQGIAIENAGSESEHNGWLITEITRVKGNFIYLKDQAVKPVVNTRVVHDDTKAINEAIKSADKHVVFDIPHAYAIGVEFQSYKNYYGMETFEFMCPLYAGNLEYIKPIVSMVGKSNINIVGFRIDNGMERGINNTSMIGVTSIFLMNTEKISIQDCYIHSNDYVSIQMFKRNENIFINGNTFINTDVAVELMPEYLGNMMNDSIIISNNYIEGGTSEGISIESGLYDYKGSYATNILIDGNTIIDKPSTAIVIGSRTSNAIVRNNVIYNCLNGIASRDIHLEPAEALIAANVTIEGNIIESCTWMGLILEGSDIKVIENYFKDITEAIMITGPHFKDSVIAGNTFEDCGLASGYIIMIDDAESLLIENNIFFQVKDRQNSYNAGVLLMNTGYKGLKINNNKMYDGISIILLSHVSSMDMCSVTNNTIGYICYPGLTKASFYNLGIYYSGNILEEENSPYNIFMY